MGVDTQAHIHNDFDPDMISDFVSNRFDVHTRVRPIEHKGMSGYYQILFVYNDNDRIMHVHMNRGIFGSHLLSMGKDEDSNDILKQITEQFSGVFIPDDCDDGDGTPSKLFHNESSYNDGNAKFLLKWALSKDYIIDSRFEDVEEANRQFREQHDRK